MVTKIIEHTRGLGEDQRDAILHDDVAQPYAL